MYPHLNPHTRHPASGTRAHTLARNAHALLEPFFFRSPIAANSKRIVSAFRCNKGWNSEGVSVCSKGVGVWVAEREKKRPQWVMSDRPVVLLVSMFGNASRFRPMHTYTPYRKKEITPTWKAFIGNRRVHDSTKKQVLRNRTDLSWLGRTRALQFSSPPQRVRIYACIHARLFRFRQLRFVFQRRLWGWWVGKGVLEASDAVRSITTKK